MTYFQRFISWLERRGSLREIRVDGNRYMDRYYLLSTRWVSIYLHRFWAPDSWRFLHDHPWSFVSVVIRGGYSELTAKRRTVKRSRYSWFDVLTPRHYTYSRDLEPHIRIAPAICYRRAEDVHRVESIRSVPGDTWTLFILFRRRRGWNQYDVRNWKPVPQSGAYTVETQGFLFPRVTVK